MNIRASRVVSAIILASILTGLIPTGTVHAAPKVKSLIIEFEEELDGNNRSKQVNIPYLKIIEKITTNTGTVKHSKVENNLMVEVSGGTPSKQITNAQKFSMTESDVRTSKTDNFPESIQYNSKGFVGNLIKNGTSRVVSGDNEESSSKVENDTIVTQGTDTTPATLDYNKDGYIGTLTKTGTTNKQILIGGSPSESKEVTGQQSANYSDSEGFKGTLTKYVESGEYTAAYKQPFSFDVNSEDITWYKQRFAKTYDLANNDLVGILNLTSETWTTYPQGAEVGVLYTQFSTASDSAEFNTINNEFILNDIKKQFGPSNPETYFVNPTLKSAVWKGGIQSGSFEKDGQIYSYKREADVVLAVDGFKAHGTYSGFIEWPEVDTRVYKYKGSVTKPDTREYTSEYTSIYSGTVTKLAIDTRTWEQTYVGEVYKPGLDEYYKYTVKVDYIDNTDPIISLTSPKGTIRSSNKGYTDLVVEGKVKDTDIGNKLDVKYKITGTTDEGTIQSGISANGLDQSYIGVVNVSSLPSGNYKIVVWVEDDMEGKSSEVTGNFVVDKTPPTKPILTPSTTSPTNGNVTVNISFSSDTDIKQYKIGSGGWVNYTGPILIEDNTTIYAKGVDSVGNTSSEGLLEVSNLQREGVVYILTVKDKDDIEKYRSRGVIERTEDAEVLKNMAWLNDKKTSKNWVDGIYTAEMVVNDNGRAESKKSVNFVVLRDRPEVPIINISGSNANVNYPDHKIFNGDLEKHMIKEYAIGSGAYAKYTGNIDLEEVKDGTAIYAKYTDVNGNYSIYAKNYVKDKNKPGPGEEGEGNGDEELEVNANKLLESGRVTDSTFINIRKTDSNKGISKKVLEFLRK